MTTINTDYNNTELLDQELTTAELSEVSGGHRGDQYDPNERWHSDDFEWRSDLSRWHNIPQDQALAEIRGLDL